MNDLQALQRLFDFTDDDLTANRAGTLSKRQHEQFQRLLFQRKWSQTAARLTLGMFLVTLGIYLAVSVTYGGQLGPFVMALLIIWLVLVYALSQLIAQLPVLMLRRFQFNPALPPPLLEKRTSPLIFNSDGEHRSALLRDLELTTDVSANHDPRFWKLQENQVYTIYFVENPFWVACIEPTKV